MVLTKTILLVLLTGVAAIFGVYWLKALARHRARHRARQFPTPYQLLVGLVTDFFDTLGIGSFATTTSLFRLGRVVDDEKIPGTLNVGHCLPTLAQALIYISIIEVEMKTLLPMLLASVLGAWLGAGVVSRLPRRKIQMGLGVSLLVLASLIVARMRKDFPEGGEATGLDGGLLAIAVLGNFVFGALMTIGIGAYAPIMLMVSLLGMNPKAAFPIMMGSCAFLMPIAGIRFIRTDRYDPRAALGLTLAGVPGVLLAAFIIKELPLDTIRWLVVGIVVYTAATLLYAASRGQPAPERVSS